MSFLWLVTHDVWVKKARSTFTALAVAVGVMVVVALGTVTDSVRTTSSFPFACRRPVTSSGQWHRGRRHAMTLSGLTTPEPSEISTSHVCATRNGTTQRAPQRRHFSPQR